MKEIREEIKKMTSKTKSMRLVAMDKNMTYEESDKLRKEEEYIYGKCNFFKGFLKAWDKVNKKEGE